MDTEMQGNVKVNFNGVRQKRFTFPNTALKLQITKLKLFVFLVLGIFIIFISE